MARWAVFTVRRGGATGASAPRRFGADGRELRRPWRMTAEGVRLQVRHLRAARRQPLGPRVLGMLLLGVAGVAALHPVGPMAWHVAGSASARTVPGLLPLSQPAPVGAVTAPPTSFCWGTASSPHTLVVCDASYAEIVRVDGIGGGTWQVTEPLAAQLAGGGTFHWYVLSGGAGAVSRSPLESFTIEPTTNGR